MNKQLQVWNEIIEILKEKSKNNDELKNDYLNTIDYIKDCIIEFIEEGEE